ncbi:MAG: NAD(P)/FAD-dependent oxidoreductase [Candidatus Helarchaeota archaeon]
MSDDFDLNTSWDVVICGAGAAGCAFAISLDSKLSVLVLEKNRRTEMGHDWVDAVQIKLLDGSPLLKYINSIGGAHPVVFYSPNGKHEMRASLASGTRDVDRKDLAKNLVSAVEKAKNITIIFEAVVTNPIVKSGKIEGIEFRKDDKEFKVSSRLLVDCTGFSAILRKKLAKDFGFLEQTPPEDTFVTKKKYIKNFMLESQREYKIYFGRHGGIQWISSLSDDYVELFAGVIANSSTFTPSQLITELEDELAERYGNRVDFTPTRAEGGAPIPTRRCVDKFCEDGFLLIGDSACQAEPITGSGVASGMLGAEIAADVVNDIFRKKKALTKKELWRYAKTWIDKIGGEYASTDLLRRFLLGLTEDDIDFIFGNRIMVETDLASVLRGEPVKIGFISLLTRLIRGIKRLDLLLQINQALSRSKTVKSLYLNYPSEYDEDEFNAWVKKTHRIFIKYR